MRVSPRKRPRCLGLAEQLALRENRGSDDPRRYRGSLDHRIYVPWEGQTPPIDRHGSRQGILVGFSRVGKVSCYEDEVDDSVLPPCDNFVAHGCMTMLCAHLFL